MHEQSRSEDLAPYRAIQIICTLTNNIAFMSKGARYIIVVNKFNLKKLNDRIKTRDIIITNSTFFSHNILFKYQCKNTTPCHAWKTKDSFPKFNFLK